MRSKPSNKGFLEMWSYAPTPSKEMMVASGSTSVMDCNMWATTQLWDKAYWKSDVANMWATTQLWDKAYWKSDVAASTFFASSGTFPTAKQDQTWAHNCESASLSRTRKKWSDCTSSGLAQTRQELQLIQLKLNGWFCADNLLTRQLSPKAKHGLPSSPLHCAQVELASNNWNHCPSWNNMMRASTCFLGTMPPRSGWTEQQHPAQKCETTSTLGSSNSLCMGPTFENCDQTHCVQTRERCSPSGPNGWVNRRHQAGVDHGAQNTVHHPLRLLQPSSWSVSFELMSTTMTLVWETSLSSPETTRTVSATVTAGDNSLPAWTRSLSVAGMVELPPDNCGTTFC